MNRRALIGTVTAIAVGATLTAQSVTTQLGITEGRAKEAVFDSFMAGALSLAGKAEVFTAATPQMRVAMVNAAATLARAFVESDEFTRRYADHREANGPDPLPAEQTADQVLAKQRAGFEQQVEALRKQFVDDSITPEQKATLEQGFEAMRARFTEMEKGPQKAELESMLKEQRARQVGTHAAATRAFEAAYPADPRALVAMRLRAFLDISKVEALRKQFVDDSITPEQKATLEQGFEAMRARFTEMEKGPQKAELESMLKEQRARQVGTHAAATRAFEAAYPADPRALVAMRLRAFLDISKDVAVDARLVTQDTVQRFVDPVLEARPREWKMCFRAGRPATDAARQFAGKWLSELESQGVK